jgi:hypothetical protein
MIYSWCTFLEYYSVFSPLQNYFLSTHGNGEIPILGKLPYCFLHCHIKFVCTHIQLIIHD